MEEEKWNEILKQKENIFEHVLYEMEMYLSTYRYLIEISKSIYEAEKVIEHEKDAGYLKQLYFQNNICLESHQVHLRNLLEFFRSSKNCESDIIFTDLLDVENNNEIEKELSIKNNVFCADWSIKKVINKSISHLTKERVIKNITQPTICVIKEMGKDIPSKIKKFIEYLSTDLKKEWAIKENLVIKFAEEHNSEYVQKKIKSINDMLYTLDPKYSGEHFLMSQKCPHLENALSKTKTDN